MRQYKREVVRKVARETRVSQRLAGVVLDELLRVVREGLREGHSMTFPGFGTFYTSLRKAGQVRSIRNRKMVKVPERRVAAFRVGEVLKRSVRALHGGKSRKSRAAKQGQVGPIWEKARR